jgi:hypothetical protein
LKSTDLDPCRGGTRLSLGCLGVGVLGKRHGLGGIDRAITSLRGIGAFGTDR